MKAGVYLYRGSIVYRFTFSGWSWAEHLDENLGLSVGDYAGFRITASVDRHASSTVSYADGDGYHHCINYHY